MASETRIGLLGGMVRGGRPAAVKPAVTKVLKTALIGVTGDKRIKVRAGTGSQRGGVMVYLPRSLRLTGRRALVTELLEGQGFRDFIVNARPADLARNGGRVPFYTIQPLMEPTEAEAALAEGR